MAGEASHPVIEALRAAHAVLDSVSVRDEVGRAVGWVSLAGMGAEELAETVRLQAELEGRVCGLRLHAVAAADAGGAAEVSAATDTHAWAARAGVNRARSWGGVWLATLLEEKYTHTRAGLAQGLISEEHAAVIVRAAEQVPDTVSAEELAGCEAVLVDKATRMPPRRLRRAARRLLEPLSKRLADQMEGELLIEEEHRAERRTWLRVSDNGDGMWSIRGELSELHALILTRACETLSAPRRQIRDRHGNPTIDESVPEYGVLNLAERQGLAFCELLEHLPEHGHARSGITITVNIDAEKLLEGYGAGTLETGAAVSWQEARRLACHARHVPVVWGGSSVPLDLGKARRLFTPHQALALSTIHDTCLAEGCERPFAWCELHHRQPWSHGGPTDLTNAAPLCGYHHRRIHDQHYEHQWLPDGTVRFRHRWPSRWNNGKDPWITWTSAA